MPRRRARGQWWGQEPAAGAWVRATSTTGTRTEGRERGLPFLVGVHPYQGVRAATGRNPRQPSFTGLSETGATGLEPATSGVTGHFERRDMDDVGHAIALKPNAKMVVRLMSSVGEKDTIVRYLDLIESLVAAGRDPIASRANLAELRAGMSPLGFRPSVRVSPDDPRRLTTPTLLVWVTTTRSARWRSRRRRQV
jgi:hypothetical protein